MSFLRRCAIPCVCVSLCLAAAETAFSEDSGVKNAGLVAANADTSDPDAWGYTWVRSTDPGGPVFDWVDIDSIGIEVTGLGDDNNVGPFPLGFEFPYYWYSANIFRIGSNGYITLSNQTANFAPPFAQLPNTSPPNDLLAILVGDLDFTNVGAGPRCLYWSNGVDSLVVSFINVGEWQPPPPNPNTRHTFQVILSKADSSITYQYGRQQGQFNLPNNNRLCIGWENQTGQIGLSYVFSTVPPHPMMPDSGLAIKIKRTVNTGLQVTDVGIVGGFNSENHAKIVHVNQPDSIKAVVKNFGTVSLANVRVTYAITGAGQPAARDTVFISSMPAGQQVTVVFPRTYTPAVVGSYSASFNAFVPNDIGPGNNTKVAELTALIFFSTSNTLLAYEANVQGATLGWISGGGFGVFMESPVPVRIESVYVRIAGVTVASMIVEVLEGSTGLPGAVLGTRTVNAFVGMNGISFVSDSIVIPDGKFFIGARGELTFSLETQAPISYRTWEYTNGYAPYRSRDLQDVIMRAAVRRVTPVGVDEEDVGLPTTFALEQNYPNPFNPSTEVRYAIPKTSFVTIKVYTMLGQEVTTLMSGDQTAGHHVARWDGRNMNGAPVSSGMYFCRMDARTHDGGGFVSVRKMLLMK